MQLDQFRSQFKRLNGVYATEEVVLFRNPLELYSLTTGETIAKFHSLDEALAFEIDGKTIQQRISAWNEIVFPVEHGGRGGGSGMGFGGKWPSSGGGGAKDETTSDFPARMNTKLGINRTYEDMVRAFAAAHASADIEHGIVVDAQGFATKYRHGNAGSISGLSGNGTEIAIHNHPKDGWPTFSKEDVINTAMGSRRGIVAVSSKQGRGEKTAQYAGTYSFIKGNRFDASGFIKAVNKAKLSGKDYNDAVSRWLKAKLSGKDYNDAVSRWLKAKLSGKDYNDAVSRWLKANQKKYGYKYSYTKA